LVFVFVFVFISVFTTAGLGPPIATSVISGEKALSVAPQVLVVAVDGRASKDIKRKRRRGEIMIIFDENFMFVRTDEDM
jgi:hypothetical protein